MLIITNHCRGPLCGSSLGRAGGCDAIGSSKRSTEVRAITLDELGDEMFTNAFSSTLYGFR